MKERWDVVIVGAGPAGAAAALGALCARPEARVLLLDRSDFPRDKPCGDGIAPHVLDELAQVGVTGLLADLPSVRTLRLQRGSATVARNMTRPAWVVPRRVFDARLVEAAIRSGAVLRRHRVRTIGRDGDEVLLDDTIAASVVVGADGAHSVVRAAAGLPSVRRRALAIRGYAPTSPDRTGEQVIVFGQARQPSYAWSFDRGDGWSNVGYGELLRDGRSAPTKELLLTRLAELLPGSVEGGQEWKGHHLPLSSWRWRQPDGRLLLAGDAAGLVNPMTGEGIYYAVATGLRAGRAAVGLGRDDAALAGTRYRAAVRSLLARHLRHTSAGARLVGSGVVVEAGIRAAAGDQRVFDDLVEVGLGGGLLTPRVVRELLRSAAPRRPSRDTAKAPRQPDKMAARGQEPDGWRPRT